MARQAPGPRGEPILGNARRFQKDILTALQEGRREHGDVVRFVGIGPLFPVFLVAGPEGIKHVLQDKHQIYPKTPFVSDRWRALVGDGLICSEGDFWRRQRRLAQPAFHRQLITSFGQVMVDTTEEMLGEWDRSERSGATVDITSEMTRLALGVLGQALFAANWRADAKVMEHAVHVAIGEAYRKFEKFVSLPEWVPTPANRKFREAKADLDKIIYRVIRDRQADKGEHPNDLLESLMLATEDDGTGMTVEQVRNEVMTFMFGGHETVASGLTWALFLLSRHPEVTRKLMSEVDAVLGDRQPTVDDLAAMPYLECVVRESLRLYPPVSLISRTPTEDDEIAGYHVPKGSMVLLSAFVTHRHPEHWPNPEGFDPDRWADGKADGRHRYSWWPFSGGPRKCIGDAFGLMEMQLVIAMIVSRFQVSLIPGQPVLPRPGLTLGQQEPVLATLTKRSVRADAVPAPVPVEPVAARCPVMHD
ncbi:cytochrome P450 [Saccharothrix ecbatanensis]|uniref:Cytochrome P450 n=1 Tax=Saccharothrix ecbatanensis TaxID=1105145 RepID=A0A7W9HFM3_9PSEU|nr:cytochrome P450 [Saccharothrix ecbatanensis]MBB5801379.1 cytochrome P450 [Saccharothrix ecbatanensis]